jgi:hypothetical protein
LKSLSRCRVSRQSRRNGEVEPIENSHMRQAIGSS